MDWGFVKKWFWAGLIVVALLLFALIEMSGRQPVAEVTAVKAARRNLSASISTNGKVEPITPYTIRAQYPTFVEKVLATEGQQVKRGQLLMVLSSAEARAALARAREQLVSAQDDLRAARGGGRPDEAARIEGNLRKAQAEADRLQSEHEALERLLAKQAATREEVAQNQLALDRARADLRRMEAEQSEFQRRAHIDVQRTSLLAEQYRSEVASLEERVGSSQVTAPADGTLYSLPVRVGDFVRLGDLLAEMADLRQVRVRAFIDEPELGGLEPGQSVTVTWDALPDRVWQGKTEQIPKQVVPRGNRSVGELLCNVDNARLELLPNINVNVRIQTREREGALAVPRAAVQSEDGRRYVYVIERKVLSLGSTRLEKREIQVGVASATEYEVVNGLQANQMVALPGDVDLRDGMEVKVIHTQ